MAESKGELTRRAILDAAIERFGREGVRATSVADIARDAGVGSTLTYAYFPNKSALYLAALDEDAAAIISEGLADLHAIAEGDVKEWRERLFLTLVRALDRHPLARRVLAGLEPDTTDRVLEIGALNELRKACAERIRREQLKGHVRDDIDPVSLGNGFVTITLALLMGVVQVGGSAALTYGPDVQAVFEAALMAPPAKPSRRARS
jgi:AcrR family transcriptional regulator